MDDHIQRLKQINDQNAAQAQSKARHDESVLSTLQLQEIVVKSFSTLIDYLGDHVSKTEVINQLEQIGTPDAYVVADAVNKLHETLASRPSTDLSEVTAIMSQVLEEAKQIPKSLPETPEQQFIDYREQLNALKSAIEAVGDVVRAQELKVDAPIVNVPETNVNVEAPDLSPLEKGLKDVTKAVKAIVIPKYETDNKDVEKLLRKSNKLLEEILDKPVGGGGGGGGRVSPYELNGQPSFVTLTPDGKIPVEAGATSTYESRFDTTSVSGSVFLGKAEAGSLESDAVWQVKKVNISAGSSNFADHETTFTKQWSGRTGYTY